jgi:hypothetical protein
MNTTQQVGGAVGVAVASSLFATRLVHEAPKLIAQGVAPQTAIAQAMVSGFALAYWALAAIAFAGCAFAIVLLRGVHLSAESGAAQTVDTQVVSPLCPNRAATGAISLAMLGSADARRRPDPS